MEYLGIVWLTSWLLDFFSSSNPVLMAAESGHNSYAANVLLVAYNSDHNSAHNSAQKRGQSHKQRRKSSGQMSSDLQLHEGLIKPLLQSFLSKKSSKSQVCQRPDPIKTKTQFSSFLPIWLTDTQAANSGQLISHNRDSDNPTQTMLQWMDEILPIPGTTPAKATATATLVQVVRSYPTSPNYQFMDSLDSFYEIWVGGCLVGKLPDPISAHVLGLQLQQLLQDPNFDPQQIEATIVHNQPAIQVGSEVLLIVSETLAEQLNDRPKQLALNWINNLRQALAAPPLTLANSQSQMYGLQESKEILTGLASWYGPYFHGRLTANGETYNQYDLTAAHPSLPFDTYLKVTNLDNGKSVIVRINDRGPYIPPRTLDLSLGAAQELGSEHTGVIPYKAVIMKPAIAQRDQKARQEVTRL
ncbi:MULTISPECIES: septal ring lytic transglycosylase RlpA family protein [Planktothricoides]|uniref:Probable endolytic peptidoglycan transglycosylase RlpA n=3 Tax=Planktothricoides raciborskii TaxID=132608 RepID=A0AAU8JI69_9CYAN|nr:MULTISPECIES: septal ring lytic transglycosylase RlpA family protein [Planktothricoides]